ncbi:MAG: hypothetical protein DWG81_04540 [Chloroflexi bacterium]|nr:hypothetical protein [Chloroflexota bacterium]
MASAYNLLAAQISMAITRHPAPAAAGMLANKSLKTHAAGEVLRISPGGWTELRGAALLERCGFVQGIVNRAGGSRFIIGAHDPLGRGILVA